MYNNQIILKSLFLAPIPLLVILFTLFVSANLSKHSVTLEQIPHILLMMLIIWGIYCVIVIPIAYAVSIYLNSKNWLNLLSIFIFSLVLSIFVFTIIQIIFVQSFPTPFWSIYLHNDLYPMPIFTGFCYWITLRYFRKRANKI